MEAQPTYCTTGLITRPEHLYDRHKRTGIQCLCQALRRAIQDIYDPRLSAEVLEIAIREFPDLSQDVLVRSINRMREAQLWPEGLCTDETTWMNTQKIAVSTRIIRRSYPFARFVDFSLLTPPWARVAGRVIKGVTGLGVAVRRVSNHYPEVSRRIEQEVAHARRRLRTGRPTMFLGPSEKSRWCSPQSR